MRKKRSMRFQRELYKIIEKNEVLDKLYETREMRECFYDMIETFDVITHKGDYNE